MKAKINLHQQAAEKTRAKILKAARQLFIERGFTGTSIGAIATEAAINQSLVYHYFESKEDLWRQVKIEIIASIEGSEHILQAPPIKTLDELFEHLVIKRFQLYSQNPDIIRLLMWQMLEDDASTISGTSSSWMASWLEVIGALQKSGVLHSNLKPQEIMMLLNGVVWAPFLSAVKKDVAKSGKLFCQKMVKELKRQFGRASA